MLLDILAQGYRAKLRDRVRAYCRDLGLTSPRPSPSQALNRFAGSPKQFSETNVALFSFPFCELFGTALPDQIGYQVC